MRWRVRQRVVSTLRQRNICRIMSVKPWPWRADRVVRIWELTHGHPMFVCFAAGLNEFLGPLGHKASGVKPFVIGRLVNLPPFVAAFATRRLSVVWCQQFFSTRALGECPLQMMTCYPSSVVDRQLDTLEAIKVLRILGELIEIPFEVLKAIPAVRLMIQ